MVPSVTACTNGRGMMMTMAGVRCTATPVKCAGAGLRTYLRAFRGVHKQYLHLYVATDEAMLNTKRITPMLVQRMCARNLSTYSGYT
jgi:hypothetical protein